MSKSWVVANMGCFELKIWFSHFACCKKKKKKCYAKLKVLKLSLKRKLKKKSW